MVAGIFKRPASEYRSDNVGCDLPSLNAGTISMLLNASPRHAWHAHPKLNPDWQARREQKFDLGTAAHRYILERDLSSFVVVDASDWRTN